MIMLGLAIFIGAIIITAHSIIDYYYPKGGDDNER